MPTTLPPDYKPRPADGSSDPADPGVPGAKPAFPPAQGGDVVDLPSGEKPINPGSDAIDPGPGWTVPHPIPGLDADEDPAPAAVPSI